MNRLVPLLFASLTYTYVQGMPIRPDSGPVVHNHYNRLPNLPGLKGLQEQILVATYQESLLHAEKAQQVIASDQPITSDQPISDQPVASGQPMTFDLPSDQPVVSEQSIVSDQSVSDQSIVSDQPSGQPIVSDQSSDQPIEPLPEHPIRSKASVASSCINGFQTYADTTWNLMGLPYKLAYTLQACIDVCNSAGSTVCAAAVWYNGNACVMYTQAQTVGQVMTSSPDPNLPRTLITRCSSSSSTTTTPPVVTPVPTQAATQAPSTTGTCVGGFITYTDSTYDLMGLPYTVAYSASACLNICSVSSICVAAVWYNGNACVPYTATQAAGKVIMKSPDPKLPRTLFVRCTTTVTQAPTQAATQAPTQAPTTRPPTAAPTQAPTTRPPTPAPTQTPTSFPILSPDTKPPGSHGLAYAGGSVMTNPVRVYLIYYGTWTNTQAINIINTFTTNLGTSPWWNIQTTYYYPNPTTGVRTYVQNGVTLGGYVTVPIDTSNGGTSLGDGHVSTIISKQITSGKLPFDNDGVYIMLSSSEVYQTGFCSSACGWHTAGYVPGTNKIMKYGWVGDASTQCPNSCMGFGSGPTPNGHKGADGIISVLAHEIAEAVSDPLLSAWRNADYTENADKCAWNFGPTYTTSSGAKANMNIAGRDYLVQTNWKNRDGGGCVLKL